MNTISSLILHLAKYALVGRSPSTVNVPLLEVRISAVWEALPSTSSTSILKTYRSNNKFPSLFLHLRSSTIEARVTLDCEGRRALPAHCTVGHRVGFASRHNVEDAGFHLATHRVLGPAEQRAVVKL